MSSFVHISSTIDSREQAEKIALELLEKQQVACVQVSGPITSRYRWKGEIVTREEWTLCAKAREEDFMWIEQTIQDLHPYEVPEIVAIPIKIINENHRQWLILETARD
jgi:periplasmic divalent cation tolerance protein